MKPHKITPQQLTFCQLYARNSNAMLSYSEAYEYTLPRDENDKIITTSKEYNISKSNGSRLLSLDYIRTTIRDIFLELFNEKEVDARLSSILLNGQEQNSVAVAKIFNDLKQRVTKKIDITSSGRPLSGLSDQELQDLVS